MSFEYKKHHLYPDKILIRDFVNNVEVSDIIDSWNFLIENNMLNKSVKGVINNLTNCDLKMDFNSFQTLISFIQNQENLKGIKLAVICDTPKKTVFPILGSMESSTVEIKPFSTLEAAESWIMFE